LVSYGTNHWSTMEYFTYEGLKYLRGLGYSRIVLISPGSNRNYETEAKRGIDKKYETEAKRGIEKAKNEISGKCDIKLWLTEGCTSGSARTLIHDKLSRKTVMPEAFLVLDDVIASGVIFALQEKNIRIPEQIAILTLSVKGVELLSPVPLTRMEYNPDELAQKSFDQLFDKLNGRKLSHPQKYYPTLIVGKSCGEGLASKMSKTNNINGN